jgi:antitoxin component YwqK of YwqJK toxin-antitoxin module
MKQHCTILIALTILTSIAFGQAEQDSIHYFSDLFPENGIFIRPDSLPDGIWIAYCETNKSQIGLKLHYKNGDRNGESISFWPNGQMQQIGSYENGCLAGKNEKWYKNGIKESESYCHADNFEKHFYHCNIFNYWSKDGTLLIKDGTGQYISFHDNDTLQVVGEYLNSERNGKWVWYYDNSNIQTIEYYNQGKHDREFITFYINGQKRIQGIYSEGKQVGIWEHWYMDGKNEEYESRVSGKRDGIYKYWHRNGQLSALGNYKSGTEEGIWKYWDDKGKLETEDKYIDGKLVETKNYR